MKIYERVPSEINIPVGIEIELERGEILEYRVAPMVQVPGEPDWVFAYAQSFRVRKESE